MKKASIKFELKQLDEQLENNGLAYRFNGNMATEVVIRLCDCEDEQYRLRKKFDSPVEVSSKLAASLIKILSERIITKFRDWEAEYPAIKVEFEAELVDKTNKKHHYGVKDYRFVPTINGKAVSFR